MIVLGVTGRSGCGKSTVTSEFALHGAPAADGDQISREVLLPGSPCLGQLAQRFGSDILRADGTLDRRLLADRAFATPEGTAALTAITHPEILRRVREKKRQAAQNGARLFLIDGAAIVGTPFEAECDRLLVVTAPLEQSVARICARDGISEQMALRRLNAQLPEQTLLQKADHILCNDSTPEQLRQKTRLLLAELLEEANAPKKP